MDGLEDGRVSSNVSRRGESESSDQSGAHVGENVAVEVRGHEDGVGERRGVLDDLEGAGRIDEETQIRRGSTAEALRRAGAIR